MAKPAVQGIDMGTQQQLLVKDVEADGAKTSITKPRQRKQIKIKHFPIFIIGTSVIQVILMYTIDRRLLAMVFGIDPHRRHEVWRFVTMMLVHTAAPHLWTTIIMQMILGVLLEIVHNWKRTAIVYFASVLGGSLFITVLRPHIYAVGASAGVYGLLFSHFSTVLLNWNETDRKFWRFFGLLFYIVFDVSLSLYLEIGANAYLNTSNPGHIEGGLSGFLVSILVLKNIQIHRWENRMKKVTLAIVTAICVTIFLINTIASDEYLPTEWNFDYRRTYQDAVLIRIAVLDLYRMPVKGHETQVAQALHHHLDSYIWNPASPSVYASYPTC